MKLVLIAALALSVAAPVAVTVVPSSAEAQVLAGRNAARAATRTRRPALSEREENRLYAAQDEVTSLTQQIEDIQAAAETQGAPTPAQTAQLHTLQTTSPNSRPSWIVWKPSAPVATDRLRPHSGLNLALASLVSAKLTST